MLDDCDLKVVDGNVSNRIGVLHPAPFAFIRKVCRTIGRRSANGYFQASYALYPKVSSFQVKPFTTSDHFSLEISIECPNKIVKPESVLAKKKFVYPGIGLLWSSFSEDGNTLDAWLQHVTAHSVWESVQTLSANRIFQKKKRKKSVQKIKDFRSSVPK